MNNRVFYIHGVGDAMEHAKDILLRRGCRILQEPQKEVTHVLLPVPTVETGTSLAAVLEKLPEDVTVFGGNMDTYLLEGRKVVDLLKDEDYLAENAAITADCALRVAARHLPRVWKDCTVLILGWGRIGKCLAKMLRELEADVTVAARNPAHRSMAKALGFHAVDPEKLYFGLMRYRVIFNTVPHMLLPESLGSLCRTDCIKVDLASKPGIGGCGVIWARGLPGKYAPESSGELIARTVMRLACRKEG